jgi:hypothetical protein
MCHRDDDWGKKYAGAINRRVEMACPGAAAPDNLVMFPLHRLDSKFRLENGLGLCLTCGGGEASLTTHCPQRRLTGAELDAVQRGDADFVDGRWVAPAKWRGGVQTRRTSHEVHGLSADQIIVDDPFDGGPDGTA